jgi:hypothetical protein
MRKALLAVLLIAVSRPVLASGPPLTVPWPLDPYGGTNVERAAFHDGRVGVLMGRSPWAQLFEAWRLLHHLAVGAEAGPALDEPCCDSSGDAALEAAQKAWSEARRLIPNAPPLEWFSLDTERDIGNFVRVPNCFADAFTTAAQTLHDRITTHGADDASVKSWLATQDAVFANCAKDIDLPPPSADAPDWLKADRAYQEGAAELYRRHFAEAVQRFAAIGNDAGSPWHKLGPYLSARAAVHAVRAAPTDAAAIAEARQSLVSLAAPELYGHDQLAALTGAFDFRVDPERRRGELAELLTAPVLPATAAIDFKDSRLLGRTSDGAFAYLDWITVFGRTPDNPQATWFEHYAVDQPWKTDADALQHARERWMATNDPAWLIAAMASSDPGKDVADLLTASRSLKPDDPAFLTAAYHRLRLTLDTDPSAARAELDALIGRFDLTVTSRNLFLAQRTMVARDEREFARLALRRPPCPNGVSDGCIGEDYGMESYDQMRSVPGWGPESEQMRKLPDFGPEAALAIDRMALSERAKLAEDDTLPETLRLDVALTNWTRAVLLENTAVAVRMAQLLRDLLPQLAPEWTAYSSARNRQDQRIAGWFLLAKMPGAAVDLADPNLAYVRPVGSVSSFQGRWPDWLVAPRGARLQPAEPPAVSGDQVCFGLCDSGKFPFRLPDFIAAQATQAAIERSSFTPGPNVPRVSSVWEELLGYMRDHPRDPRAPEALSWLIHVSHYGTGHNRSGYRAFNLLHERYPTSTWAKQSKYYYD